jgi:ElaB/YqjD/DUF883 family membrane-anchored ribosome-binding protein
MADQAEVIRQQMADTRASMTEKIEALEKQVTETVKETTETVSETVDTASETVQKTVEAISDTVEAVKETFDIPAHIQNHPWMAMGGAVALGYALGHLLLPSHRHTMQPTPRPTPTPTPYQSATSSTPTPAPQPAPHQEEKREQHPNLGDVLGQFKELAIGTAVGLLGKVLLEAVPQDVRGSLSGWVNQLTEALGGKKVIQS